MSTDSSRVRTSSVAIEVPHYHDSPRRFPDVDHRPEKVSRRLGGVPSLTTVPRMSHRPTLLCLLGPGWGVERVSGDRSRQAVHFPMSQSPSKPQPGKNPTLGFRAGWVVGVGGWVVLVQESQNRRIP